MQELNIDQALEHMDAQPVAEETKISVLWEKIRPFVVALSGFLPKKIRPWLKAFIAALDSYAEEDV